MADADRSQTISAIRVAPPSRLADDPRVEQGAMALAWTDLTPRGRTTTDWLLDFSEAERQHYRAKVIAVMEAINV